MHRGLPAMGVETLMGRPLGVFGHRLGPPRRRWWGGGAGRRRSRSALGRPRRGPNRPDIRRRLFGLLVIAAAEANCGQAPEESDLALLGMLGLRRLAALSPQF